MKHNFMLCENKNYKEFLKELSSKRHSFIFQLKFDGIRALVLKDNGNITILNRNNIDYTNKFPELLPYLKKLPDNSIFDGEIIVKNSKGFSDFNKIQMRTHNENPYKIKVLSNLYPSTFIIFDVLCFEGYDKINLPLRERLKLLKKIRTDKFIEIAKNYKNFNKLWNFVKNNNLEGVIAKDLNSKYVFGRSNYWIKIKNKKEITLKIVKYEEHSSGIVLISELGHRVNLNGILSKKAKDLIIENGYCLAEVEYLEMTNKGNLRQPIIKGIK